MNPDPSEPRTEAEPSWSPPVRDTVVVFTGGAPTDPVDGAGIPAGALVIAADSGLHHAQAAGRHVDLAVGDFDSVSGDALDAARRAGTRIERYEVAKSRTDLAIALDRAVELGAKRIVVLGADGGRLDHFLGNVLVLGSPSYAGVAIECRIGGARVHVVHESVDLHGTPGELVTLLAVNGPAEGVVTDGLLYPLSGERLDPGSSRGVSNELLGERASVRLRTGTLLVVQPGSRGTHLDLHVEGAK